MTPLMARAGVAAASTLVASIVIGGMIVFAGSLGYPALADATSPGLAVSVLVAGAAGVGGLIVLAGQLILRRTKPEGRAGSRSHITPELLIMNELTKAISGSPTKLVATSLAIGFVLGLSPRLRRIVYKSLVG
jgi:hypothetical protein